MTASLAREAFLAMIARSEEELDLAAAALLIAREEYPDLDVNGYLSRLDGLAEAAKPLVKAGGDNPFAVIDGLNDSLFRRAGFQGNVSDYFDPRNSYLNDVMDRRRGIPITLSLIYLEVAARLGFSLEGVGLPGHFIVRHAAPGRHILIDPFHGGQILLPEDCQQRMKAAYGKDVPLEQRHLEPAGKVRILARMLNNLKWIYIQRQDHARALSVIERLMALSPGDPRLVRDRGLVRMKLSQLGGAAADLEAYLARRPDADDAARVRGHFKAVRRLTAMLN